MHFRYKLRSDCFETPKNVSPQSILAIWDLSFSGFFHDKAKMKGTQWAGHHGAPRP